MTRKKIIGFLAEGLVDCASQLTVKLAEAVNADFPTPTPIDDRKFL